MHSLKRWDFSHENNTAIPYRASTGPEKAFSCVLFLTGKTLFNYRETLLSLQGPCFHYRQWVCSVLTPRILKPSYGSENVGCLQFQKTFMLIFCFSNWQTTKEKHLLYLSFWQVAWIRILICTYVLMTHVLQICFEKDWWSVFRKTFKVY